MFSERITYLGEAVLRVCISAPLVMAIAVTVVRWILPGSGLVDRDERLVLATLAGISIHVFVAVQHGDPMISEIAQVVGWVFRRNQHYW